MKKHTIKLDQATSSAKYAIRTATVFLIRSIKMLNYLLQLQPC